MKRLFFLALSLLAAVASFGASNYWLKVNLKGGAPSTFFAVSNVESVTFTTDASNYQMNVNPKGSASSTSFAVSSVESVTLITDASGDHGVAPNGDTIRMVDLGLPSGTLWADRNVGADCPADTGNYYAWGETNSKKEYSWSTYLCAYSQCWTSSDPIKVALNGNRDIGGTQFDVATANWGVGYEMPDSAQIKELVNTSYTTWEWTARTDKNGHVMNGYLVTGKSNGNSIFLPASAVREGTYETVDDVGSYAYYWSCRRRNTSESYAYTLYFISYEYRLTSNTRCYGRVVRPVLVSK